MNFVISGYRFLTKASTRVFRFSSICTCPLILYLFFGFVFTFITVTGITQCNLQKHKKTNVLSQGGTNIN